MDIQRKNINFYDVSRKSDSAICKYTVIHFLASVGSEMQKIHNSAQYEIGDI
jgi:hypothetical protein